IDEAYTKKIREYTTETFFNSPLTDYLPASKTVPTPMAVLGDVAGAPGVLPYSAQVHEYMRMLEKASPRVKVFSIGKSEEGREMIAVAISSEANMAKFEENRARLGKLADPRSIKLDDNQADLLVNASVPIYYITGSLHAGETGSPTALMELAYRLVVDDAAYIKAIRANVITLITPVVETDGRDRWVDIYKWHLANPKLNWPSVVYWGKYVLHDNNRDAMVATLALTRNIINATIDFKPQVLHDLHESVAYLYDNTVGDGPYNAWVDPILADEWQLFGWNNMSEMTKFGMPGAFAHGTFDTWSPGYLMFIGAMHNGVSRLYETFGNGGADTVDRTLGPSDTSRTWYRQNPALPKAKWSQRNNNNYTETGLLTALSYFSGNTKLFLKNFYLKSKRSIVKPKNEGPAAYVLPADDARPGPQAELLRVLQRQGVEISRATAPFTVTLPAKRRPRPTTAPTTTTDAEAAGGRLSAFADEGGAFPTDDQQAAGQKPAEEKPVPEARTFPAGSYVVRMDQPYSRIADALLDYQYWSPNDPQKRPYDDTGWTLGEVFNVQVVRVTDTKALDATVERVVGEVKAPGAVNGTGGVFVVNHDADPSLLALRYRLKDVSFEAAEEPFEAAGKKFNRGSFLIRNAQAAQIEAAAKDLGLQAYALPAAPSVKTHAVKAPRIGYVHTWQATQDEGWWRMELDRFGVPYEYISTQVVAKDANLNAKYDVIIFPPVGRNAQAIINGLPMWGNPLPWKTTALTPNIGKIDQTEDTRPGLGYTGVLNLDTFVRNGGLLITTDDTADLAVNFGLTQGVSMQRSPQLKAPGTIVRAKFVDSTSPIAYGYAENVSVYIADAATFSVSSGAGGGRRAGPASEGAASERPTGRGTVDDPDVPQGRPLAQAPPEEPRVEPWQYAIPTEEQLRNGINIIPPQQRPRVILRFGDSRDLLVSGLLEGGAGLAQRPAVVDVPHDKGHVVLFSPNPMWRGETQGSYFMVFNAILNFDNLDAGRKLDAR
ncbi:MAG: M14 family zinc carboxypeptidase, partial [Bacteroidales bacterium]